MINEHDVINSQMPLVFTRHGNGDGAIAEAHREITARGRHPAFLVDKAASFYQLLCGGKKFITVVHVYGFWRLKRED